MSKLLQLPLTLIAVLAAMLFLPGLAWADTPTAEQCASATPPQDCPPGGDTSTNDAAGGNGTTTEAPKSDPAPAPENDGGTTGQQPGGSSAEKPAASLLVVPFQVPADVQDPVGLDDVVPTPPLDLCTTFPQAPACAGETPPTVPLTCDGLAELLGQTGGCPSSFSCEDLAQLLGLTCPAGPPDCQALAALFHLEGCPQPPTSCQEFADLLGVDNCSQIPCLDTSKLPQQARDGLGPLFDGLKQIGIKQCPAAPAPTTPGKGTYMPPAQPAAQQQQPPSPYYANCTEARAAGATNIPQGSPGYRPELDADHDGFACDEAQTPVAQTAQPSGKLAYTGLDLGPQLNVAWTLLVLGTGLLILGRRRA